MATFRVQGLKSQEKADLSGFLLKASTGICQRFILVPDEPPYKTNDKTNDMAKLFKKRRLELLIPTD